MLLKPEYQGIGFEDAFKIPLEAPKDELKKEKLNSKQEFAKIFIDRYPRIAELVNKVTTKNPKKKDSQNQCLDMRWDLLPKHF